MSFGAHVAPTAFPFRGSSSRPALAAPCVLRPALTAPRVLRSSTTVEARPSGRGLQPWNKKGLQPRNEIPELPTDSVPHTTIGRRPSERAEPQNVFRFGARSSRPVLIAPCVLRPALTASRVLRSSTTVEAPAFRPGNAAVEQRRGFSPGTKFLNYRRTPSRTTTIGRRPSERTEPQNVLGSSSRPTLAAPRVLRPALTAPRVLRSSTTVEAPAFRPGNAAVEQRRGFSPGTKFQTPEPPLARRADPRSLPLACCEAAPR